MEFENPAASYRVIATYLNSFSLRQLAKLWNSLPADVIESCTLIVTLNVN